MFEVSYVREENLPKLIFILSVNNAVYKIDRKNKKIKIIYCNPECKSEVLTFLLKHQTCDICGQKRARYLAQKDGKVLKVCQFCKSEHKFDSVKFISLKNVEMHHDIATGLLRACVR
jgi:hypothetical protein